MKRLTPIIILLGLSGSLLAQTSDVNRKLIDLAARIHAAYSSQAGKNASIRIAVTEFAGIGELAEKKQIGPLVSEVLSSELARYENFTLIERLHLARILEEQKLALSGIIDSETSVEIGNLLGAQALISGSVLEAGNFFIVNARMVDVEKSAVILTESVEIPQDDLIALSNKLIVTKKYALDAAYRSALLPGWGQFYNDTPKRGAFYLTASVVSLGAAVVFKLQGDGDYKEYQKNTWDTVIYYDKAANNYQNRDYALYALAGCWALNVLDAWRTARRELRQNRAQTFQDTGLHFGALAKGQDIQVNLGWSF